MVLLLIKNFFSRAIKDKRKRVLKTKKDIAKLEDAYDNKFEELKSVLVQKLFTIVGGKTAQGIFNDLGEEVFPKGKKYTQMLSVVDDYAHLVGGKWTTDSKLNKLVKDLFITIRLRKMIYRVH